MLAHGAGVISENSVRAGIGFFPWLLTLVIDILTAVEQWPVGFAFPSAKTGAELETFLISRSVV